MDYTPPAYVIFVDLNQYEVNFILKKKQIRSQEIVRANSSQKAKELIYARFGKDNVTITSVKEVKD